MIACDLRIGNTLSGIDLWVLEDRSSSVEDSLEPQRRELELILEKSKHKDDDIHYVDFARNVIQRGKSDKGSFSSPRDQTNLKQAVEYVLTQINRSKTSRILVLSDGFSTEPLEGLSEKLSSNQVALDYRIIATESSEDYSVARVNAPSRVSTNEGFLVEITVKGSRPAEVPYALIKGTKAAKKGIVKIENGLGIIRFFR